MGRIAGDNMVHCRGLANEYCPDYIKTELIFKNILYPAGSKHEPKLLLVIADISDLSLEAQFYLRLMEICKPDKYNSSIIDAVALSDFILEFCEMYESNIGHSYSVLLGKALILKGLSSLELGDELLIKMQTLELRSQIELLKSLISGLFDSLRLETVSSF